MMTLVLTLVLSCLGRVIVAHIYVLFSYTDTNARDSCNRVLSVYTPFTEMNLQVQVTASTKPHPTHFFFLGIESIEEFDAKRKARDDHRDATVAFVHDPATMPADKADIHAQYTMRWGKALFSCSTCWLLPGACVCDRMRRFPDAKLKVAVLLSEQEWGRASNSGSIIARTYGGGEMFMRGLKRDDQRLREQINDPTVTTAILWPSESAMTASELNALASERTEGRVRLIALDGTWAQARRMIKHLADVPKVRLSSLEVGIGAEQKESLLAPVRRYGGDFEETGRVSTLEAIVAALRELGEEPAVCDGLLDNLKIKIDSLLCQNQ